MLVVTTVTAWFSYAYFHPDEYFQVFELTRSKLDPASVPVFPWEHAARLRPWLQPAFYWLVGRGLGIVGVRDLFDLAFAFRLLTGLINVGAVALFLRTTLPWQTAEDRARLHLRVVTLAGFLPYLFVRTSSESGSMAALTVAWALLLRDAAPLERRRWAVPELARPPALVLVGFLFGVAFELRFQTVLVALGTVAWLLRFAEAPLRSRLTGGLWITLGGASALGLAALVDRWGYGSWSFPAATYFQANILEGAAGLFGTDPPFAYYWLLPANLFLPSVVVLMVLAPLAWLRHPRHPLTWATLPFFVLHNLLSHKEERFLFPIAILATGLVVLALAPSTSGAAGRVSGLAAHGWVWAARWPGRLLALTSLFAMALLAFVPIGWNHNVRFMRFVHRTLGDEVRATAFPEIDLTLPAFHPRIYDLDKADPEEIERRIDAGSSREWLVTDRPVLHRTALGAKVELVYTELPWAGRTEELERGMALVDAYNARAEPPLRRLRFRSLYRVRVRVGEPVSPGAPR
jgi:GPI mannosyltransferase 3